MGTGPQKSITSAPDSEESDARAEGGSPDSGYSAGMRNADATATEAATDAKAADPAAADTAPDTETADAPDGKSAGRHSDRSALVIAAAALAACAGFVLYGVLTPGDQSEPESKAAPSAEVTYEVEGTGTVDISYRALGASGKPDEAATATKVQLPWKKSVKVPLGQEPNVSIVLGEKGGQARCALAIRGRHVQSATASGTFGRATCSGPLPEQDGRGGHGGEG